MKLWLNIIGIFTLFFKPIQHRFSVFFGDTAC